MKSEACPYRAGGHIGVLSFSRHKSRIWTGQDCSRSLRIIKTAAEICALFDSVYVSFYKGIGGIAGAILAGGTDFVEKSKVWKRRHGGDLVSLYPYIISSSYYYKERIGNMGRYYEEAKELAALFNQCEGVNTKPAVPVSNMFHVHFEWGKEQLEPILIEFTARRASD